MCDAVQNLHYVEATTLPIELAWDAPENNEVAHYEIYRDSKFLGTTEELAFSDETPTGTFTYIYSVRPVYENCNGLMSSVEVYFSDENVNENNAIKASIYPNPSQNDFNIVCDNMTRVTVYNVMGSVITDAQVNDSRYTISDLESGVYFINIETNNGNVVRKVVKL